MKARSAFIVPIVGAVALLATSCALTPEAYDAATSSGPFVNAADIDLTGQWQRSDAKSWQTINPGVSLVPAADVTINKVADGFYQYSYTVTIPQSDPPVVREGKETRSFDATYRMAVAPDGTLRGIDVADPLLATYWVRDENTVDAVLQEGGPEGAIVTYTLTRTGSG
jgi:hypothetical protein